MKRNTTTLLALLVTLGLLAAACGDEEQAGTAPTSTVAVDAQSTDGTVPPLEEDDPGEIVEGTTITLFTHGSFAISESTLEAFTELTGVTVELLTAGDVGALVSQSVIAAGDPLGDVMFGIDNTFLQRGLDADLFVPYASPGLADVPDEFELDPEHRVTPIDFGDVCVNYWIDALDSAPPATLDDLIKPEFADMLVVENPETSSPGFAFLLATIGRYDDWESYWQALVDNGVSVAAGWEEAYYGEFSAGGGDRPLVVSYASSPAAEVLYSANPEDGAPTGVVNDTCFRQIEFAGVLKGTEHRAAANAFIDFMLTPTFQDDIPLNMFVFPVANTATLPEVFVDNVTIADNPVIIDPAKIEANRNRWTAKWTEIVLG